MSRRVYLGHLPQDLTRTDIDRFFDGFRIVDTRLMGGFGFLEFESSRDVDDACRELNGKRLLGQEIIVEPAKENARRRDPYESSPYPPQKKQATGGRGIRIVVKGLHEAVSWQDLKDFGREGGPVIFADVDRAHPGQGVLEYPTMADAQEAVSRLSTLEIRGSRPEVFIDTNAPPPVPRDVGRPPRDYPPSGGDYPPRRSYRDDPPPRSSDPYPPRRSDRSPRRDRSPPPRSSGYYDDRRGNGYGGYERRERDRSPPAPRPASGGKDDYRRSSPPPRSGRDDERRAPLPPASGRDGYRRDDREYR